MDTKSWGPHGWYFLHTITFNYPDNPSEEHKYFHKQLFTNFAHTLPCKYCRQSYKKFMMELPIDNYLSSKKHLALWLYKIHNKVNDKLKKQGYNDNPNPTFHQVCIFYEQFRASCSSSKMTCSF